MEETDISSYQKFENYSEQFKRLNEALKLGFNLEAIFIEYAILEDRTESLIRHGGLWENYLKDIGKGRNPGIDSKIKFIKKKMESNRKDLLNHYFSCALLDALLQWKEKRNRLIHALLKQQLTSSDVESIAREGEGLVKKLRNQISGYKRALNRRIKKQE